VGEARRRRLTEDAALAHGGAGPRLAVCLIARNEAENLPRALASVAEIADEIVVVDTGSTDDTVAVARRLGARVGRVEWQNDFAAARNAALELATARWILSLDADEELAPESVAPLRRLVAQDAPGPTLLTVAIESVLDSGLTSVSHLGRLFPNLPSMRFHRPIHEEVTGAAGPPQPASGVTLRHYGYLGAERARQTKVERNLAMLLAAVERDPRDVASWYYLGVEYGGAGMHAAAADLFERWLDRIETVVPRQGALRARQQYATALHALGRTELAARVAADGAGRYRSAVLSALAAGYTVAGEPASARRLAESALDLAERSTGEPWPRHSIRAAALTVLGDVSRRATDLPGARRHYAAAADADPTATQPRLRLAELAADGGDLPGARAALLAVLAVAPADVATHLSLARLERRMGILQEPFDRLTAQVAETPRSLDLRLELAAVLYDAGEYALGVDVLSAAEELPELAGAPPAFRAHYFARIAHGCVEARRFDEAMRAYRNAFQADPGLAGPRPAAPGSLVQIVPSAAAAGPAAPFGLA
jgi:tetratricopeptide (TPR) repeat protein